MVEEMAPLRSKGHVDPGWEHGIAQDDKKKKVKCNYCGKIVSGGIFRLKQHLARISGEVTHCAKVPEEVYFNMRKNLEGCCTSRKRRQSEYVEEHPDNDKQKGKRLMCDKNFVVGLAPLQSLGYVDPGWEHCVAQDEKKKKVKCNYCQKIVSGGINRFKQHLARIPGEVSYCDKAPEEVYLRIKENMKWHRTGRRIHKYDEKELSAFYLHVDNEEEAEHEGWLLQCTNKDIMATDDNDSDSDIVNNVKVRTPVCSINGSEQQLKRSTLDAVYLKSLKSQTSSHLKEMKANVAFERKSRKEVLAAICKFFYHAGIASNAADSPYFHKMLEMVGQYGQDLRGLSSRSISGRFLKDEVSNVKDYLAELRSSWTITGCSVLTDSWDDLQGRTLINFLVSCSRGTYFVSSVDATNILEDAPSLFKLLDNVVEEIGEENVVQVITKNTTTFKNAGKMLEQKRRTLFWSPCVVHCIDRMLQDFLQIKWVGYCVDKAKRVTRFIYNNPVLLSLMKKEFTNGEELLKPTVTKFGTTFFTLGSLLEQKIALKKMFQSNKWVFSQFAKCDEGKEVEKIILNINFWKKLLALIRCFEPVAHVLRKIDTDESQSMPIMYNDMYRAKLAIKSMHGDGAQKYGPFWSVIDNHMNTLFHHPLYLAAYFLNPSFQYQADFLASPEVVRGLNECITRLEVDSGKRISASMQIQDFESAKAGFGSDLAISTRMEFDPAAWWQRHGISCLELQRMAMRILSQTCSSIGYKQRWSLYDQVHSKTRSSLCRKRWNELTYVHYNLRLQESQLGRRPSGSISLDNVIIESILDDWLVEAEKPATQVDEAILYSDVEQFFGAEIDVNMHDENHNVGTVTVACVEPSEVNPAIVGDSSDDDAINYLDDDFTD